VGFPFADEVEYMHLNPLHKGRVKRPHDGWWPSYNNSALGKATVLTGTLQRYCRSERSNSKSVRI